MKLLVKKGKTSKRIFISIQDSSSTTGAGLTGLTSGSAGLICYRAREDDGNAAGTQLSLSAGTRGTWSSGGFVEKDSTNMKGIYELGLDNAGLATGSDTVVYILSGATNMAPCRIEIQLVDFDPQDAVHLGISALPNTACTTNASLITSGTGTDQLQVTSGLASANEKQINGVSTSSVTTVNANIGETQPINFTGTGASALVKSDTIDWNSVGVGGMPNSTTPPTTAQIATGVWQDATASDFTTASSIGKSLYTSGVAPGAANGLLIAGSNAATTFATLTSTGAFSINGVSNVAQTGDAFGFWTTAMTESYAGLGAAPTPVQALFGIQQCLTQFSISGTTLTVQKLDRSTTAETYTLNDATNPTSRTRAS